MRAFFEKYKKPIGGAAAFLFWMAAWQILSAIYGMDFILPSPFQTLTALGRAVTRASFWREIGFSTYHILLGFLIAGAAGLLLAFAGIRVRAIRVLFDPFCVVIRAVPVASFIILVLVMFPTGLISTVISALMGFPVVYSTVASGLDAADPALLDVSRVFGFGYFRTLRCVYLPHIRTTLSSALSVASGLCFKSGVAAEVIGIPRGSSGFAIYQTKVNFDMPALFSYTVVLVVVSVFVEKAVTWLLRDKKAQREGEKA